MHHCIWPAGEPQQRQSSWDAKSGRVDVEGADYLFELGASQQYNINLSHGQSSTYIDSLFTGTAWGVLTMRL